MRLAECLVSPGWRLELQAPQSPGIHYNLMGMGRIVFDDQAPIEVFPHTLIVVPPCAQIAIEAIDDDQPDRGLRVQDNRNKNFSSDEIRRHVAGRDAPEIIMICGYFQATFGATIDLFSGLKTPIVEQFDPADHLDSALQLALAELMSQEVGDGAMATALLKQVMVMLLRRSLKSSGAWVERFSILSDPQIARAFAAMVERPGAPHSVQELAQTAGLARSTFIERFSRLFGRTPMATLRDLRMRQAALELMAPTASLDEVVYRSGYKDRTGFARAFRRIYGCDPLEYRAAAVPPAPSVLI